MADEKNAAAPGARRPRVVFMGTPEFAVPSLSALAEACDVALVVTRPDAVRGRGRRLEPSPVKAAIFLTAWARVSVLPARMSVPEILASPSVTVTGLMPSIYSPSGRPAACMESVMATTLSQPLHFKSMRTVPGCRWRPSQMASQ